MLLESGNDSERVKVSGYDRNRVHARIQFFTIVNKKRTDLPSLQSVRDSCSGAMVSLEA